jgi:hypothetical protein
MVQINKGASDIEQLVKQLAASPLSARSVVGLLGGYELVLERGTSGLAHRELDSFHQLTITILFAFGPLN